MIEIESRVDSNGTTWYYKKGTRILHREDGPAVEYADGSEYWYKNGKRHRDGGPAVQYEDGSKYWYQDDKVHREDGPAIERASGHKEWYVNGKLHREDGPAIEDVDGYEAWYLFGDQLTEEEFNERMKYDIIKEYNGTYYYKKGTFTLHREDGPAIVEDHYKAWYIDGKSHREGGPAFEYANGDKSWYLFGDQLTEEEFNERMGIYDRSEYKITTGALILEVDGKELAFKTKEELVDYLTREL